MDACIDSLNEATIFSTLYSNSGDWQVAIAPEHREKTIFVCHEGASQYERMPFGLTNAPATLQRALDIILSVVKWQSCLIYCCLPNFGRCGRSQDRVSVNCPLVERLYPAEWMGEKHFRTVDHPS